MPTQPSISRLKSVLLTSGLQQKDQPLFQVINGLIDALGSASSGGGATGVTGPAGPQGVAGANGVAGLMPLDLGFETDFEPDPMFLLREIISPGRVMTLVPYASGNFTANGLGTWTVDSGDILNQAFLLIDRRFLIYQVVAETTSVGGTPSTQLQVAIPNGYKAIRTVYSIGHYEQTAAGSKGTLVAASVAGDTIVRCIKNDTTNWGLSTNDTYIRFTYFTEVTAP